MHSEFIQLHRLVPLSSFHPTPSTSASSHVSQQSFLPVWMGSQLSQTSNSSSSVKTDCNLSFITSLIFSFSFVSSHSLNLAIFAFNLLFTKLKKVVGLIFAFTYCIVLTSFPYPFLFLCIHVLYSLHVSLHFASFHTQFYNSVFLHLLFSHSLLFCIVCK